MFVDAKAFSTFPLGMYWPVGAEGLLARSFHLRPLMIDPKGSQVLPKGTIDAGLLARACPDPAHVHVVTDSDELVVFELTAAAMLVIGATRSASAAVPPIRYPGASLVQVSRTDASAARPIATRLAPPRAAGPAETHCPPRSDRHEPGKQDTAGADAPATPARRGPLR